MDGRMGLVEVGALPPLLAPLQMELMLEGARGQKKQEEKEDKEQEGKKVKLRSEGIWTTECNSASCL